MQQILIPLLLICMCAGKQVAAISTSGKIDNNQTARVANTFSGDINKADTIIIHKEITNDYRHIIYIDQSHDSQEYKWLVDFQFNEDNRSTYEVNYEYFKKEKAASFKKQKSVGLPKHWLPVYSYKNAYYLYAPSDWGNAGRRIVNDSAFVYWYMDGPYPVPLQSVNKVNKYKYVLSIADHLHNDNDSITTLTLHIIDPKSKLTIFEFSNASGNSHYQLYIPVENADKFDMIINHCNNQKQMEYNFEKVDYVKLLKDSDNSK